MMAESSAEFGLDDRETSVGRRTANLGTEIGYRVVFFFGPFFFVVAGCAHLALPSFDRISERENALTLAAAAPVGRSVGRSAGRPANGSARGGGRPMADLQRRSAHHLLTRGDPHLLRCPHPNRTRPEPDPNPTRFNPTDVTSAQDAIEPIAMPRSET